MICSILSLPIDRFAKLIIPRKHKVYVKQEVFGAIGTARTGFLHAADNADHLLLAVLVTVPHDNMHPSI